jgi:hypothetical protein
MAKFLLLYAGGGMPETEAEVAAVLQAWTAWYTKLGSAVVDPGNPIGPVAKRIGSNGRVSKVGTSAMASGYTIIEADSIDAAVELAKQCPVLLGGAQIRVYETFPVM